MVEIVKQNLAAGLSLLASVLGMVVTMILHPTGHEVIRSAAATQRGVAVHSLALATIPLALFGFLILTQRLRGDPNVPIFAYIVYVFGSAAVMGAVIASGFLASAVATSLRGAVGTQREVYRALFFYSGSMNHAFAIIHVLAHSLAIVLWSVSIWRLGGHRWVAGLGLIVGAAVLAVAGMGHLTLNVHGAGLVVLAHGIWIVSVAAMLIRETQA